MCRTNFAHACLVGMLDVHTEAQLLQNCPLHFDHLSLRIDIRCVQGQRGSGPVDQTAEAHRSGQALRETLWTN